MSSGQREQGRMRVGGRVHASLVRLMVLGHFSARPAFQVGRCTRGSIYARPSVGSMHGLSGLGSLVRGRSTPCFPHLVQAGRANEMWLAPLRAIAPLFCRRPGKLSSETWHKSAPFNARRTLMCDPVIACVACSRKQGEAPGDAGPRWATKKPKHGTRHSPQQAPAPRSQPGGVR